MTRIYSITYGNDDLDFILKGGDIYFSISCANDKVDLGTVKKACISLAVEGIKGHEDLSSLPQECKDAILKGVNAVLDGELKIMEKQITEVYEISTVSTKNHNETNTQH